MPRFVTATTRSGSKIHAVDTWGQAQQPAHASASTLCRTPATASRRQEFLHTETETNCYLCRVRVEKRLVAARNA